MAVKKNSERETQKKSGPTRNVASTDPSKKKALGRAGATNKPLAKRNDSRLVTRIEKKTTAVKPSEESGLKLLENEGLARRMDSHINPIGRPRVWRDTDQFVEAVNEWISLRKKRMTWRFVRSVGMVKMPDPKLLTIASLCHHLGICTETFRRWCADEEHPLHGICHQIRTAIEADLWDADAEAAPLAKLNLQSNFGHRTKADITTDGQGLPKPESFIDPGNLTNDELKIMVELIRKARKDS